MSNRLQALIQIICRMRSSNITPTQSNIPTRSLSMSSNANGLSNAEEAASKRKLKILMLHGYTQSGSLFHAKTRALEKLLQKAFPSTPTSPLSKPYPGGVQLIYPTAPIRLLPADIPGFSPVLTDSTPDAWGWWRRETGGDRYVGLEEGLQTIADSIREVGGVDGVIGFSQGGAAAAFVASLLEDGREDAFAENREKVPEALPYPESFRALKKEVGQNQLRFAVSYSGFWSDSALYRAFYEPKITTRVLHVIGSLDTVVEEGRSTGLVKACVDQASVLYHPGGHFVPISKDVTSVLVGFIRQTCEEKKAEDRVEDMDVPF